MTPKIKLNYVNNVNKSVKPVLINKPVQVVQKTQIEILIIIASV